MPRLKRSLERTTGIRDSRFYIIACEGSKTEQIYFESLAIHEIRNPRVKLHFVRRNKKSHSAPNWVIDQIDEFKKEYEYADGDEFWVVVDVDKWGKNLSRVSTAANQKRYNLAVSNPCFEIWLLLHLLDIAGSSIAIKETLKKSRGVERKLKEVAREFRKNAYDPSQFFSKTYVAIHNSKKMPDRKSDRWPQNIGTRLHLLIEKLIKIQV